MKIYYEIISFLFVIFQDEEKKKKAKKEGKKEKKEKKEKKKKDRKGPDGQPVISVRKRSKIRDQRLV